MEEINNRTGPYPNLLPGVRLGYHLYDTCAIQAGVLASVNVMQDQEEILRPLPGSSPPDDSPMVVIGPDSSSRTMPTAVLLGAYLVPQVSCCYRDFSQRLVLQVSCCYRDLSQHLVPQVSCCYRELL